MATPNIWQKRERNMFFLQFDMQIRRKTLQRHKLASNLGEYRKATPRPQPGNLKISSSRPPSPSFFPPVAVAWVQGFQWSCEGGSQRRDGTAVVQTPFSSRFPSPPQTQPSLALCLAHSAVPHAFLPLIDWKYIIKGQGLGTCQQLADFSVFLCIV